jgi:beta-lactamase class D
MKSIIILFFSLQVIGATAFGKSDRKAIFEDLGACFKLVQISSGKVIEEINPKICGQRFSPNSTFKIPLALMGFEKSLLKDENQLIKWDWKQYDRKELNQDQTPMTWMDRSVVWVSQWITPQLTESIIQKFLKDFDYGNQDFSGGINKAWLDSSLKISPNEQITFMTKFWKENFPLSKKTFELTKKITFIKKLDSKAELFGKTGTGCRSEGCDKSPGLMQGWFIGILKTQKDAYAFAAYMADKKIESAPAGPRIRSVVTQVLNEWDLK